MFACRRDTCNLYKQSLQNQIIVRLESEPHIARVKDHIISESKQGQKLCNNNPFTCIQRTSIHMAVSQEA